jgi:hypothetical protein
MNARPTHRSSGPSSRGAALALAAELSPRRYCYFYQHPCSAGFLGHNLDASWDGLNNGSGWPGECELRFVDTRTLAGFRNGEFLEALRDIARRSTHVRMALE